MKKIISSILAITMLFALCVPAFAVDITSPSPSAGSTVIKTDLTSIDESGYFTVSIPASTDLKWGQTEALDLHYTVETHFSRDKRIDVKVIASGSLKTADNTFSLAYKLNNGGEINYLATDPVVYPAVTCPLNLTIAKSVWDKAVVETYTDTLTFDVSVKTV